MRALVLVGAISIAMLCAATAEARGRGGYSSGSHSVRGYTTKRGTYVAPHHATNPNRTKSDNWTTRGNTNPYTGKPGTRNPW